MKNNLKKVLKDKNISAYKMAKDLDISFVTAYNWCNSDNLSPKKMKTISKYLEVDLKEVFEM